MRGVTFNHIERLVDGAADDRVEELEWVLAAEEVKADKCGGRRTKLAWFDAGESGRVAQLGPVAEDRGGAEQGKRFRLQASEAKRDGSRNALRRDLQQTGHVLGGRAGPLPCNRVEHRADEERISAGRRFERGAEGFVRIQTVQLAREHRDRGTPERFGGIGAASGSAMSSATSLGSRLSPSGGRDPAATRRGTPSSIRVR